MDENIGMTSHNQDDETLMPTTDDLYFQGILKRKPGTETCRTKGRYTEEYKNVMRDYYLNFTSQNANEVSRYFNEPIASVWSVLGVKINKSDPATKRLKKETQRLRLEARRARQLERAKALDYKIMQMGGVSTCTKPKAIAANTAVTFRAGLNGHAGKFSATPIRHLDVQTRPAVSGSDSSFLAKSLSEIDRKISALIEARTQLLNLSKII